MNWLIFIGFIVAAGVAIFVFFYIFEVIKRKWMEIKHPDFDRKLTTHEVAFIENSQKSLQEYTNKGDYKSPTHWLLYCSFLPAMFGVWILGFVGTYYLSKLQENLISSNLSDGEILYFNSGIFGAWMIVGVFAGIMVAGWLCYFLTGFNKSFTSWMVLTTSASGHESNENILDRRLQHITQDVRMKRLDINNSFKPESFLHSIAKRHGEYCGIIAIILLTPAFFFLLFFDSRQYEYYTSNKLVFTHYWTGNAQEIRYQDLSHVEVGYYLGSKNKREMSINFYGESEESLSNIDLNLLTLDRLLELNSALEEQGVQFKAFVLHPPGRGDKSGFTAQCKKRVLEGKRTEDFAEVLHFDELSK